MLGALEVALGGLGRRPPDEEVVFNGILRTVVRPPDFVRSTIVGRLRAGWGRFLGGYKRCRGGEGRFVGGEGRFFGGEGRFFGGEGRLKFVGGRDFDDGAWIGAM